jgi:hypothetical protein
MFKFNAKYQKAGGRSLLDVLMDYWVSRKEKKNF